MSKSKKNVIDPESIIKNFGADSVRLFILSETPEKTPMVKRGYGLSINSFKNVALHCEIKNKIKNEKSKVDEKLNKFISQFIK